MNFIKKQSVTAQATVNVPVIPGREGVSIQNLQTLLSNLTPEELDILAKIAKKPLVKSMALSKAKSFI